MAVDWCVQDAKQVTNNKFLKIAEQCKPVLLEKETGAVSIWLWDEKESILKEYPLSELKKKALKKGDFFVVDFGTHGVGYCSFVCESIGNPQDAPAFLKMKFCEAKTELFEDSKDYNGNISSSWIQEEWIHLDLLPEKVCMPRRYAFRFLRIDILDTSHQFRVQFLDFVFRRVSAVDMEQVPLVETTDGLWKKIDQVAIHTLQDCMQDVFEDGPKRDRRLWLGDLRLQAKTNYLTFKNYELVKRCLYLFAGMPKQDGMIAACLYTNGKTLMDKLFLMDYALFFCDTLKDYYEASGDRDTLEELYPSAQKQIELAEKHINSQGVLNDEGEYCCFIDWQDSLNRQCAMNGVYLYTLSVMEEMASILVREEDARKYRRNFEKGKAAVYKYFWDEKEEMFVSGEKKQISAASQVWMVLADVIKGKAAQEVLGKAENNPIKMITPYMNHCYVEALLKCGNVTCARDFIKKYWGGMVENGADTFWEVYNPENPKESPYDSAIINSYCHAWSCTPSYLFRKYQEILDNA